MSRPLVIVVDDDPLFRSLLASMLRHDYAVSVAADGADGYYKALERVPQLAIIDVQMPGWDGLRTLKAFRTNCQLAHVPVMIMTSDAGRPTVMAALDGGANDFVVKTTLTREELLTKVARLTACDAPAIESGLRRRAPLAAQAGDDANGGTETGGQPITTLDDEAFLQSFVETWD